jgi:hypothetical protein
MVLANAAARFRKPPKTDGVQKQRKHYEATLWSNRSCMQPLLLVGNDAVYPTEKIASFVIEKVDITTFPSALRPKREKGKKTFRDYGSVARELDDSSIRRKEPRRFRSKYWKHRNLAFTSA